MLLLEKGVGGPMCEFTVGDNPNDYVRWEQQFTNLATLDANSDRSWSAYKTIGNPGVNCGFTVEGVIQRKPVVRLIQRLPLLHGHLHFIMALLGCV
jgi:hypothetical protein